MTKEDFTRKQKQKQNKTKRHVNKKKWDDMKTNHFFDHFCDHLKKQTNSFKNSFYKIMDLRGRVMLFKILIVHVFVPDPADGGIKQEYPLDAILETLQRFP